LHGRAAVVGVKTAPDIVFQLAPTALKLGEMVKSDMARRAKNIYIAMSELIPKPRIKDE
jgi:hypothetical protein